MFSLTSRIFRIRHGGFIREGYDADLIVVDKIPEYEIKSQNFKTKAKYTPFEGYLTSVQIFVVFDQNIYYPYLGDMQI